MTSRAGLAHTDNRLAEMPMAPVSCHRCGARVEVRKSSWTQTSVQWNAEALAHCQERHALARLAPYDRRGLFLACASLTESISDAVRVGTLRVVADAVSGWRAGHDEPA